MCLILLSKPKDGNYKFVLTSIEMNLGNENMFWWNEAEGLLAAKTLTKGTWLGISNKGKFALVTNVREFYKLGENKNFYQGDLKNFSIQMKIRKSI